MGPRDLNRDADMLRDWLADRTGTRWWVRYIEPDSVVACSEWAGDAVKLWAPSTDEAYREWPARLEAVSWPFRPQSRCG